jgi:hypothetical protein
MAGVKTDSPHRAGCKGIHRSTNENEKPKLQSMELYFTNKEGDLQIKAAVTANGEALNSWFGQIL